MTLNFSEVKRLLEGDDTFAFTLMTILLAQYGDATFTEDPIVLFKNLEEDFNCKLSEENENRINAALTAITTDLPYHNLNVFKAIALAFTEGDIGGIPDGEDEEVDGSAALWAITEISLLNDDTPGDAEGYSKVIHEFVGKAIAEQAADNEKVSDNVDTIKEAINEPYFFQRLKDDLVELSIQLHDIGCDEAVIQGILKSQGVHL